MLYTPSNKVLSAASVQDEDITVSPATTEKHNYGQILKSSALIGGSSIVNIAIGIVRTKAMAVLLGPAGFGLMGLYGSIADLAHTFAGMGINSSGVRQIAEAVGTGETERIARTVVVLRWTSITLGALGGILLVAFARQASTLTFGTDQHSVAVALLSLVVFFRLVSGGQGALIQGMRRISDLARMGLLSALFSTILSIPIVFFLRENGVVPSLVGIAAITAIISWWYSRKVKIQVPVMTTALIRQEAGSLLKLGLVFMASGFLAMGAAYAVRLMVLRKVGFDAAGLYQAAWTLGGMYVGIILQAMGADFLPRLTASARDNAKCNHLVNEQAQISLLLAGPGILATLTFTAVVISLFYSAEFEGGIEILRWFCLGMTLRVISWPMSFILVAKGAKKLFLGTDFAWTVVNVCISWLCVKYYGLKGAGIAFFISYVFHGLMIYPIVRQLTGFHWSTVNIMTGLLFLSSIAMVFCGFYVLPAPWATAVGTLITILSSVYSFRILLSLVSINGLPPFIQQLFKRFTIGREAIK